MLDCGWNQDPLYGSAGRYNQNDCYRIVKKLILEGYLWEELIVSKEGMAMAYVKKGPRGDTLASGAVRLELDVVAPKTLAVATVKVKIKISNLPPKCYIFFLFQSDSEDVELRRLEEECFERLKVAVLEANPQLKSCFAALPAECFQEISKKLPVNKEQMMDIDQMTAVRFDRYGEILLDVCSQFLEKRMRYLQDKQVAQELQRQEEGNFSDGVPQGGYSSGGPRQSGGGRGSWKGRRG